MDEIKVGLLATSSDAEMDRVFERIFLLVQKARESGDLDDCNALLEWLVQPDVVPKLHVEVLLSCVRLTYSMRESLRTWKAALKGVAAELARRGEDVDALLCGLQGRAPNLPALDYEPRYPAALALDRRAKAATAATVAGGVFGGALAVIAAHAAVGTPSVVALGVCAGLGALAGAMLVAHLVGRRSR